MSPSQDQQHPPPAPKPKYPPGVPLKFTPSGHPQPFPGNTILAHLSPSSPLHAALLPLHSALSTHPRFSPFLAMLPPSSWHMTIFDGVCDLVRPSAGGVWPADLPADVSLSECTAHFAAKLSSPSFSLRPEEQPPYKMRVVGFKPLGTAIMVRVEEGEKGEGVGLRGLRDRLAEKLGVRRPGHEGYVLHVSLGYLLRWLSEEEEGAVMGLLMEHFGRWGEDGVMGKGREFELGRGEFCRFEDMMAFERLCYLGEGEEGRKGVD